MTGGNTTINQLPAATLAQLVGTTTVPVQTANTTSATGLTLSASLTLLAQAIATVAGLGTMAYQNANAVAITGGSINGTTVGASTPTTGAFTTLAASSGLTVSAGGATITGNSVFSGGSGATPTAAIRAATSNAALTLGRTGDFVGDATIYANSVTAFGVALTPNGSDVFSINRSGGFTANSNSTVTGTLGVTSTLTVGTGTGNELALLPVSSGSTPAIAALGADTNIELDFISKGANGIGFKTGGNGTAGSGVYQLLVSATASANRYVTITGSNGGTPTLGTSAGALLVTTDILGTATIRAATQTAIPAGGSTSVGLTCTATSNFGVFFGSGAPTLSAAKGSIYLRSDGSTTNDRMYVNTNGTTGWTAVITAT